MRSSLATIIGYLLFLVSPVLAQATGGAGGGTAGGAGTGGGATGGGLADWGWVMLLVIIIAAAIWYFTSRRPRV